jgi:hypothetical protein
MINRKDAEAARYGMEEYKDGETHLRVSAAISSCYEMHDLTN